MNVNDTTQDMPMDSDGDDRNSRLEEVILQFLKAQDEGRPLDRRQLLEQHPDLADELREFLDEPILPPVVRKGVGRKPKSNRQCLHALLYILVNAAREAGGQAARPLEGLPRQQLLAALHGGRVS